MIGHHADSSINELVEFIRQSSPSADGDTTIIHQLVESSMGAEITASANAISEASDSLDDAICHLVESPSFRVIQGVVRDCNASLNKEDCISNEVSNKRPKTPDPPKETAPKSFSLFDMLDQQKGGFALPPRITAYKVIEARQREQLDNNDVSNFDNVEKCLDLLEKANDIEDLTPDPDSWEQIRQILYEGLTMSTCSTEKQTRYLTVHTSLMDICQRGNQISNKLQCWDLAHNLASFILLRVNDIAEEAGMSDRNLYCHAMHQLLNSLQHMALDYITSCVGDETQIERMVTTLCLILTMDTAACITAVIDPLAGWFEVWARFVAPKRMLTIIQCTGLCGVILQRCRQRDVEHANFLQSLSVLRTIMHQCETSVATISTLVQFTNSGSSFSSCENSLLSTLLTSNGVSCKERVQEHLNQIEKEAQLKSSQHSVELPPDAVDLVFQPFQDALASNALSEVPHVKWLCVSSLELYDEFMNMLE
jgi:hypothetical protein